MSSAVSVMYCGQVSACTGRPRCCAQRTCSIASRPETWTIMIGTPTICGVTDGTMGGFALDGLRSRRSVEIGRDMALALELHRHEANGVVALAMDHHQRLLASRDLEDLQQLPVAENKIVIGHEHLEGGVAVLDQRRQFLAEHDRRRIGDDQMKGGVDVAFAFGQFAILLDTGPQRRAFLLQRKGKDHGVAAGRGRAGGGSEIVGHHHVGT